MYWTLQAALSLHTWVAQLLSISPPIRCRISCHWVHPHPCRRSPTLIDRMNTRKKRHSRKRKVESNEICANGLRLIALRLFYKP